MKPTILQILPALNCGGVERGTLEVAAGLVRRGYRSIVVAKTGQMVSQLTREGSEHIDLAVGKKSPIHAMKLIPKLRRVFEQERVDIIHARSRLPAWLAHFARNSMDQSIRPHFVTTVHGSYTVNRYSKIMVSGERIIAVSDYIKDYILNNYPDTDESKIETIHRGISKKRFPYGFKPSSEWLTGWQRQYPQLADKFIITLPGRITRLKGHQDFIDIIIKARAQGLNVHGVIAGGADQRKVKYLEELKKNIHSANMTAHFSFLGHRDDMKEVMVSSNIILSLTTIPESFGRTVLEALSLGVPVVAYAHGGVKEILSRLFPEGKATPLDTYNVVSIIKQFYHTMPMVEDAPTFTLSTMLDKTLNVYNSLV